MTQQTLGAGGILIILLELLYPLAYKLMIPYSLMPDVEPGRH